MFSEILPYFLATIFGLLMGNYTTTAFYRIPRKISICGFNKSFTVPPFCSYCAHPLKPWEYLPVLSWFSTLGTCNYCKHPINKTYTMLEVFMMIMSISLYHYLGFSDDYIILLIFTAVCCITGLLCLEYQSFYPNLTVTLVVLGGIYFTLKDHTISNWCSRTALATIIAMFLLKKDNNFFSKKMHAQIIIVALTWLPEPSSLLIYVLLGVIGQFIMMRILKNYHMVIETKPNLPEINNLISLDQPQKNLDTAPNYYTSSFASWYLWLIIIVLYNQVLF